MGVRQARRRPAGSLAVLAAAILLAACSTSRNGDAGTAPSTAGATAVTTAAPGTLPPPATSAAPKQGGHLVIATEAEIDGFDPTKNAFDATGFLYAYTVFDPLVARAADGKLQPFLAESITPNAGFTEWTIRLRSGIQFSDGEPLNADALKVNLDGQRNSPLTGTAVASIVSVDVVDDLTVSVKLNSPWAVFPTVLEGQAGFIAAPKMLADPDGNRNPIGTGPFVLKEWIPGSHFIASRNSNYWRTGLPHLDSIEFRPIVDPKSRESSLQAGTIDILHTTDSQTVVDLRKDDSFHLLEQQQGRVELNLVMLNTTAPPLDDIRIRRALALALDRARFNEVISNGILKVADGPFSTGSGFSNAPGFPAFDLEKARALVDEYKREKGVPEVSFDFGTTNTGKNLQANQLIADMWSQAGIKAQIVQVEQSQYILNALLGNYQAYTWRQFGEPDPDNDYVWWVSAYALANGDFSLNMARNKNPKIDELMNEARAASDPAARTALYKEVSARLNEDLPYLWETEVLWAYAAKPTVHGIDTPTLPDGSPALGLLSGAFMTAQLSVE